MSVIHFNIVQKGHFLREQAPSHRVSGRLLAGGREHEPEKQEAQAVSDLDDGPTGGQRRVL